MEIVHAFISYSHDSPDYSKKVLQFSNELREYGIDAIIDQYEDAPEEGWPIWMENQIENSNYVILLCTKDYYKKVKQNEDKSMGLGIKWESNIIYNHLYESGVVNNKYIPCIFDESCINCIPTPLRGATRYNIETEKNILVSRLLGISIIDKPELGNKQITVPIKKQRSNFFDPSETDALVYAVKEKKYDAITKIIECGVSIDNTGHSMLAPLEVAILDGDIKMVRFLLENGADVNYKKYGTDTLIMHAIMKKDEEMVMELCRYGADIHIENPFAHTTPIGMVMNLGLFDLAKKMKKIFNDLNE